MEKSMIFFFFFFFGGGGGGLGVQGRIQIRKGGGDPGYC